MLSAATHERILTFLRHDLAGIGPRATVKMELRADDGVLVSWMPPFSISRAESIANDVAAMTVVEVGDYALRAWHVDGLFTAASFTSDKEAPHGNELLVMGTSREVKPGETFPLKMEPGRKCRPFRLHVDSSCAPHFELVDVLVGMRSQNPAAQSIPAVRFDADHDGGAWVLEEVRSDAPLTMYLRNTSDVPMHFAGTWECSDEPQPDVTYLVHDTQGALVMPGQATTIWTRPQRNAIAARNLWIPPAIAEHFAIDDVKVGNCSAFHRYARIPAAKFSHGAGAPFSCDTIQTAMDFVMVVVNTSSEPRAFIGVWGCDVAPRAERAAVQVMSDRDVERIASAVARKMKPEPSPRLATLADLEHIADALMPDTAAGQASAFYQSVLDEADVKQRRARLALPALAVGPGAKEALDAFRDGADRPRADWIINDISFGSGPGKVNANGTIDHFITHDTIPPDETMVVEYVGEAKEPSRSMDAELAHADTAAPSTIDPGSGKREPSPTRAERKDPPGFGWNPYEP